MTGTQYMLLSMVLILPVAILVYYSHQLSIGESDDQLIKDGIKAVMQRDIDHGN